MLIARALLGVSEAFYMPAAVALIVDRHEVRTRSRATGLHLSGVYIGSVLGGLGGWLAEQQGWRFGFVMFGSLGVAYALFLIIVLRVGDGPAADPPPGPLPAGRGRKERSQLVIVLRSTDSATPPPCREGAGGGSSFIPPCREGAEGGPASAAVNCDSSRTCALAT